MTLVRPGRAVALAASGATGSLVAGGARCPLAGGGLLLAWHLTAGMEPDYPRAGHPVTLSMLDGLTPTLSPSASNGRAVDGAVAGVGGAF